MSNNHNYVSRQIIKTWFNRAKNPPNESYNYFDRFISLWVSFNCFFVAEFYEEAKENFHSRYPSEQNYLKIICAEEEYKEIYSELLKEDYFKMVLNDFKDNTLQTVTHFPGKIADMRSNPPEEGDASEFTDINNFEQFIRIIYQVRCNLFHGNKSPDRDGDIEIVEAVFKMFILFLEKVYEAEEFILDEENGEDKFEVKGEKIVELNSLGLELSEKIQQTVESEFKDEKTMRCFYSKVKLKRNLLGLCWIDPLENQSVVVYLRKADYSSVDPNKIVKYSVPGSETFGGYPLVKVDNFSEVDYVLELIKWVYEKDKPDSK